MASTSILITGANSGLPRASLLPVGGPGGPWRAR